MWPHSPNFGIRQRARARRWRITDPEILATLDVAEADPLLPLLEASTSPELATMRADIESQDFLESTASFLESNVARLKDANWLAQIFSESRADPSLHGRLEQCPNTVKGCWMFRALMGLIKTASELKQGYGYEQLIGAVRRLSGDQWVCQLLIGMGASRTQIEKSGSTDSLRRKLVDWVSGLRDCELSDWQVRLTCEALTARIAAFATNDLRNACAELPAFIRRLTYGDRIAPYR